MSTQKKRLDSFWVRVVFGKSVRVRVARNLLQKALTLLAASGPQGLNTLIALAGLAVAGYAIYAVLTISRLH